MVTIYIEVPKADILTGLKKATQRCRKPYDKGRDSFKVLERVDPATIRQASGWADRLFQTLP